MGSSHSRHRDSLVPWGQVQPGTKLRWHSEQDASGMRRVGMRAVTPGPGPGGPRQASQPGFFGFSGGFYPKQHTYPGESYEPAVRGGRGGMRGGRGRGGGMMGGGGRGGGSMRGSMQGSSFTGGPAGGNRASHRMTGATHPSLGGSHHPSHGGSHHPSMGGSHGGGMASHRPSRMTGSGFSGHGGGMGRGGPPLMRGGRGGRGMRRGVRGEGHPMMMGDSGGHAARSGRRDPYAYQ